MKNALLSVTDKTGIVEFARALGEIGFRLFSTGGTAAMLRQAGIEVEEITSVTGFPEIMGGRVKTLHPKIMGGILADRDQPEHVRQASEHGMPFFDLVVVNLYAFAETVQHNTVTLQEAIEQIDIGGVALIRAAAKNYRHVGVIFSPAQYEAVIEELKAHQGRLTETTRLRLAAEAFQHTAIYDSLIGHYLQQQISDTAELPAQMVLPLTRLQMLRYGENPHQQAALYRDLSRPVAGVVAAKQRHGKALSYNNLMDADAAFQIVRRFDRPAAVIIKHANPCGVALADTLQHAYEKALRTDSVSAFGGIVGLNRVVDGETAQKIAGIFTEVILAPGFSSEALEILQGKKNLRILEVPEMDAAPAPELEMRHLTGGILVQYKDLYGDDDTQFEIVSSRAPTESEWRDLRFGWEVVRWVKSNAIVYARDEMTVGIGAGQMSRVDASQLAVEKAKKAGLELQGAVVASDAFFPFADGVEAAAQAGATAVIQPGGSIRDQEVIEAANRHNMAMVFTHVRHFRH